MSSTFTLRRTDPYPLCVAWYWFLLIALAAIGLAGLGIHLLLIRLGDQGLVDYIPRSPTKTAVGSAMMNFGVIYDPSLEHVIEFERSGDLIAQGSSEPLPPERNQDQSEGTALALGS